ncbi:endoglucanase 9 [Phtheirospermum japonicum]|uniref:Endoglucanase n=1 Tax=Phtheirospermum japonicum TaxID=374723 RepID=A0A830D5B9_9LAMI|nr:endoglucanase 9 [Phtheirospermum japonicum]
MAFLNGSTSFLILFSFTFLCNLRNVQSADHNYKEALTKSIIFLQGQRSGKLPSTQQITWRGDSALSDGEKAGAGVNLTGGYYDAGDNVKFNFPMAYTTTMLSWGVIEYGKRLGAELQHAREAIRWGTDYLLKCALETPGKLYVGVANPNLDHQCWERPEDMDTDRSVFSVSPSNPGSDVAAETAAALAAASIVFRKVDPRYSKLLRNTAKDVMQFAIDHRGAYSDSLAPYVCPFYCSYSGYKDELFWGAAWLFRATNSVYYYDFIRTLGANDDANIFSWDNKFAGARVLLSRQFSQQAENFMCKVLPNSPYLSDTQYTKGGLMYKLDGSNLQYVTAITFLFTTYAKYLANRNSPKHSFTCGGQIYTASYLRVVAKSQVDYILGDNPMKMSYMVDYTKNFPKRIHHRGSSVPSIIDHPKKITCGEGFSYLQTSSANPNILTGAIVGGPDRNDRYADDRNNFGQSEPTTYINAAIVGPLAYLAAKQ